MKCNPENLDELKKAWLAMGKSLDMDLNVGSLRDLDKRKTALERLRRRYGRFCILGLIMMVNTFLIFTRSHLIDGKPHCFSLAVAFVVYFFVAFCMDLWLWHGVGEINPVTMSVSEVAGKALFYRRRHLQFMAILIPYAFVLIGFLGYVMADEKTFLFGMVSGAFIGLAIGTAIFLRTMADYKRLSE